MTKRQGDLLPHILAGFDEIADGSVQCTELNEMQEWVALVRKLQVAGLESRPRGEDRARPHRRGDGTEPELPELLSAAAEVPRAGLLGPTIAVHQVRLLRLASRKDDARKVIDELALGRWSTSAQNLFNLERVLLSERPEDTAPDLWPPSAAKWRANTPSLGTAAAQTRTPVERLSVSVDAATLIRLAGLSQLPLRLRQIVRVGRLHAARVARRRPRAGRRGTERCCARHAGVRPADNLPGAWPSCTPVPGAAPRTHEGREGLKLVRVSRPPPPRS